MACRFRTDADRLLGAAATEFHLPDPERHYAPDLGLEPIHLDVALGFDLAGRQVAGEVTTTFEARRGGERSVLLDAIDFHEVDVVDADGHELDWNYDGQRLEITWAEAIPADEQRRAKVRYRVIDPLTGMMFSWPEEAYPDKAKWVCTDHETERARYWLPCVDHPTVRTPVDCHLRAGAEYTILAPGVLVDEEQHDDGTKTAHYRLEEVCPSYLLCLAVGEFVKAEGGECAGVDIAAFAPPPYTEEQLQRSFGPTRSMMEWMTAKLAAPFPFPRYYQLAVPDIGGAMENITLTTWDSKFVADETLHGEFGWLIDLINLHEMAHSYFGDSIVVRDYAHVWLKESWATYMESCWLEDVEGDDAMQWQMSEESRTYREEADKRYVRPIVTRDFDSSWDMYDHHLYPGGAFRLHMLRAELGDEDFWAAVQDYVRIFTGRVVESSDFRRTLETRSGRSLARFFDQWIHSPGYPKLKASFKYTASRSEGLLTIEQTQVDKKKGVGLFDFPIEVDVERSEGEWITAKLEVSDAKAALVVPLDCRPLQVVLDPRGRLLHALEWDPGSDMLDRSLSGAPTVSGRIQAARALGSKGAPSSIRALRKAYPEESSWGVRIEIARALATSGTKGGAIALSQLLALEEDPRVPRFVAESCGRLRDPLIAAALEAWLADPEPRPYIARGAALTALGKQRGDQHLDTLRAALLDRSLWGWVRRGAVTGLGATRTEEARRILMGKVGYGAEVRQVRQVALPALAAAARWQEEGRRKETLERLIDLTRDPDYGVRQAAVAALKALGDRAAIPAMKTATRSLAGQDRPRVHRMIRGMQRQARGGEVAALRKQVEELTEKLRKLQHKVGVIEERAKASTSEAEADPG
jgi:aminopeptidase N